MTSVEPLPEAPRYWLEAKHLLPWLLVATKGLSDESRARVTEEITTHFHDALDEEMRTGLTAEIAARRAVDALGSPRAARRGFRRTYLTRYQARLARDLIEPRKVLWFLRIYLVLAAAGLQWFFPRRPVPEPYTRVGVVALMAVAVIILAIAVPRLYRRGRQRAAVALAALADGSLWLGWVFIVAGPHRSVTNRWILAAVFVFVAISYLPLLRKFDKHREA